jgi:biotin operon repressor
MGSIVRLVLPPGEKLMWLTLANYADENGTNCYPGVNRVKNETGMTRRGVQKIMRRLENAGLLVPVRIRRGRSTEYKIMLGGERSSQVGSEQGSHRERCGCSHWSVSQELFLQQPRLSEESVESQIFPLTEVCITRSVSFSIATSLST